MTAKDRRARSTGLPRGTCPWCGNVYPMRTKMSRWVLPAHRVDEVFCLGSLTEPA